MMKSGNISEERLEQLASGNAWACVQDDEGTVMAREIRAYRNEREAAVPVAVRWRWINGDEDPGAWWYSDPKNFDHISQCADRECEFVYAAPPAQPVASSPALSKDKIREIFMSHGFTIKEGHNDLKDYVYAAAEALISQVAQPVAVPNAICVRQAIANMEKHEYCDTTNVAYKHGWNDCRAAMLKEAK